MLFFFYPSIGTRPLEDRQEGAWSLPPSGTPAAYGKRQIPRTRGIMTVTDVCAKGYRPSILLRTLDF